MQNIFKIALLCGGPSPERGISINSARSVLDNLSSANIEITPIYFDQKKHAYQLSQGQMYCNTPSDFDFRLDDISKPLSDKQLQSILKKCDIAFNAMHGQFGEDGEIQKILEENDIPFIGAGSVACKKCFDKFKANEFIRESGFHAPESLVLKIYKEDHKELIKSFFEKHKITRAVVKPASGGSSIGVYSVTTQEEALEKVELLFSKRVDTRVVIEPFAKGVEFTVIILQNRFGLPVALIPTEIEADYEKNQIFDYRKKYLPTRQVTFHCPPRFSDEVISRIQVQAEQLFTLFGMSDFARFDGWLLDSGEIWFSDFNPISGMEQNSFLFQQGARVGFSHKTILQYIIQNGCKRYNIKAPTFEKKCYSNKTDIAVLFGGTTSERQVSLMSGTNVWLKLKNSEKFNPHPYILLEDDAVLETPYGLLLNHTIEEILAASRSAEADEERLRKFVGFATLKLALQENIQQEPFFKPRFLTLQQLVVDYKNIFIALHGGDGENGTLQKLFDSQNISYNGSGSVASKLCMDKYATAKALEGVDDGILTIQKINLKTAEVAEYSISRLEELWKASTIKLKTKSVIIKPRSDGCSSGIVRLNHASDLRVYFEYIKAKALRIPANTFAGQIDPIELPTAQPEELLMEPFIETDKVQIVGSELKLLERSSWIEVTVGVLESAGRYHVLNPSITVSEGDVLSLEEKFQGGTGINITPPPVEIISKKHCELVKERIGIVAKVLGIEGYARIDAFVQRSTGRIMVIEANSLPGLTPSTVLFHQGIAEQPSIMPVQLVEKICGAPAHAIKLRNKLVAERIL